MWSLLLAATLVAKAEPVISYTSVLSQPIEARVKAFQKYGAKGGAFLIQTAFDSKEALQTRWRAITTMGRLDARAFQEPIDRALRSPEWFLRNAALIALLNDERERAIGWSIRLLEDPALVVRTQAVRNVIALKASSAEPILWKLIYDRQNFKGRQSLWIRAHLAEALAKFAGRGRAKNFERLLHDEDPRVYKWAVEGLETSTGLRLSDQHENTEMRRQKWLARLGDEAI